MAFNVHFNIFVGLHFKIYIIVTILISSICSALVGSTAKPDGPVNSRISFQDETIHLEFSGRKDWDYSVEKKDSKGHGSVEITLDSLDSKSLSEIRNFKAAWVKKVSIDSKAADGKTKISIELAADLDVFDYLMEAPSRLVVDLFPNSKKAKKVGDKNAKVQPKDDAKSVAKTDEMVKPTAEAKDAKANIRGPATADFMEIQKS